MINFAFLRITLSSVLGNFANQNFCSVRIFVFRQTTKFLFALQTRQFAFILLQKVLLNVHYFLYLESILALNSQWRSLQRSPIPSYPLAI